MTIEKKYTFKINKTSKNMLAKTKLQKTFFVPDSRSTSQS